MPFTSLLRVRGLIQQLSNGKFHAPLLIIQKLVFLHLVGITLLWLASVSDVHAAIHKLDFKLI